VIIYCKTSILPVVISGQVDREFAVGSAQLADWEYWQCGEVCNF